MLEENVDTATRLCPKSLREEIARAIVSALPLPVQLAENGYHTVLTGRNKSSLEESRELVRALWSCGEETVSMAMFDVDGVPWTLFANKECTRTLIAWKD